MTREQRCPICNSKKYKSVIYTEECWGIVEEHSLCDRDYALLIIDKYKAESEET